MKIIATLAEVQDRLGGDLWENFCEKKGFGYWAVNEGGGDVEVILTIEEAQEFGLIPKSRDWN